MTVTAIAREDLLFSEPGFAFGTLKKGKGATTSTRVTFLSDPAWEVKDVLSTGTHVKARPSWRPATATR